MSVKLLTEHHLDANRNKSRLLFSSAEMFKKPLWQTMWTQIRLLRAVCSGSILFASILKFVSNVRQLFAADDFSRRHFQRHFFLVRTIIKLFAKALVSVHVCRGLSEPLLTCAHPESFVRGVPILKT